MHFAPWDAQRARNIIADETQRARAFLGDDGPNATALLPILHALQHTFGFLSTEALELTAQHLNLSKAEVKGVVSFYKDFRTHEASPHRVALCRAEACQARGSEALAAHLAERHQLSPGATQRGVTLENAYCLGNCALGPAALVDEAKLVGRLTEASVDQLLRGLGGKS